MQCPHCSQPLHGVCLNCDNHFFQVGMTVRNESAPALLKERQLSLDKKNTTAELKKLKKTIIKLQLFMITVATAVLLYFGWGRIRNLGSSSGVNPTPIVTVLIQFN